MVKPVLMGGMAKRQQWRRANPDRLAGKTLRRKAEAGHACFDRRGGAVLLTIWFTVLFAVLPFGVRSPHETGDRRRDRPGSAGRAAACGKGYMDNFELGWPFSPRWSRLPIMPADFRNY